MTRGSPREHQPTASRGGASRDRCVAVIPARWASSRVPGKVLALIDGVPLVERMRVLVGSAALVDEVVVATDDARVAEVVAAGGGRSVRTGAAASGTHRVAEALHGLDADLVINVQCDQPGLDPAHVDAVVALLRAGAEVATIAAPLPDGDDPAAVKVVWDARGDALYFSRAPIPYGGPYWRHLGVYGFTRAALARCVSAPDSALERAEDLEQLRWLNAGIAVRVGRVDAAAPALDTSAQLRQWQAHLPRIS